MLFGWQASVAFSSDSFIYVSQAMQRMKGGIDTNWHVLGADEKLDNAVLNAGEAPLSWVRSAHVSERLWKYTIRWVFFARLKRFFVCA